MSAPSKIEMIERYQNLGIEDVIVNAASRHPTLTGVAQDIGISMPTLRKIIRDRGGQVRVGLLIQFPGR